LPTTWSATSNIVWKTDLPGPGTSSPIIVGKKIFLTCYSGYGIDKNDPGDIKELKRHLLCIDSEKGKILWKREFKAVQPEASYGTYLNLHGYASSTPVSDGRNVFVFFGKSGVFAYDLDGKEVWQTSVGKGTHGWGSATSPVLYKDLVIVNASVESGALVALNKKDGQEAWQAKGIRESWSTPVLVKVPKGGTELVVSGSKKVLGFEPENGKELWHSDSFDWYVCPTIVAHDGVVYALQNSACAAVRAGGRGDVTESHTVWKKNLGSVVTSPVYANGHLYWAAGSAMCVDGKDGTVVYRGGFKPGPGDVYASPLYADGRIYFVSRTNGAFVIEAGTKFKQLAHNSIAGDKSVFNGSPAVDGSRLLLRSDRRLYCIGKEP
jgi:outer membrane protein assembly factor BamB